MRARYPDREGFIDRNGVDIFYEVYENDGPTVVLVPTWCLLHSRAWKMQIPFLSRHFRVVTYDPRGNGRSGRPSGRENHGWRHYVDDLLGVMDETETGMAVLVGLSVSGYWANVAGILHPDRAHGVVGICPVAGLGIVLEERIRYSYTERLEITEGWAKENVHYIRSNYRDYVEFFVNQMFSETHSTKQIEDGVSWALETEAEMLIASDLADILVEDDMASFYRRASRPALVIQGDHDRIVAPDASVELARLMDAELVMLSQSGHAPNMRDPVRVNLLIKDFVERVAA